MTTCSYIRRFFLVLFAGFLVGALLTVPGVSASEPETPPAEKVQLLDAMAPPMTPGRADAGTPVLRLDLASVPRDQHGAWNRESGEWRGQSDGPILDGRTSNRLTLFSGELPPIIRPNQTLWLRLREAWALESDHDWGFVDVMRDGGRSWTNISRRSGRSDWLETDVNLTCYAGETVDISLRLAADATVDFGGWQLDTADLIMRDPSDPLEVEVVNISTQAFPLIAMNVSVAAFGEPLVELPPQGFVVKGPCALDSGS